MVSSLGIRLLVCGGREYSDEGAVNGFLDHLNHERRIELVIDGSAKGADSLASKWARTKGIPNMRFPAPWEWAKSEGNVGKAGPIRNKWLLDYGRPDLVVAFPGGKGTEHMIKLAKKNLIEVIEVKEAEVE